MQELLSAGKRKAEPERPSFTDEPLEGQKQKRPRVPVTPILPPAIAKLMATSVSASQPQASSTAGAAVKTAAQAAPAADSIPAEPEQTPSAEQPGESAQRAAYMWPSQAPSEKPLNVEREGANSGSLPNGKAASNQAIEVEELEWKPGDAAGPFAGDTVEALPLPVDERREESPPLTQTRYDTVVITRFTSLPQANKQCACRYLLGRCHYTTGHALLRGKCEML